MARELDTFEYVAMTASKMPDAVFTEPDDDWTPVAFLETKAGLTTVPLAPYMGSPREKDILADLLLPTLIRDSQATRVVMILSVWVGTAASQEEMDSPDWLPPSQQPDRTEKVLLIEYTRDGVGRQSSARIIRHDDSPPTLGEWEEPMGQLRMEGRFVGPIVNALKQANP
jgi:hypothetical protein